MLMNENATSAPRKNSFFSTVTFRLSVGYFLKMVLILSILVAISYGPVSKLNQHAGDEQLDTQLFHDAQRIESISRHPLQRHQGISDVSLSLPGNEIALVFNQSNHLVYRHGPLTPSGVNLLQHQVGNHGFAFVNQKLQVGSKSTTSSKLQGYRLLVEPLLSQNTRVGVLVVGLPRQAAVPPGFWWIRGFLALLIAAVGGFFMARNSMNPARMIVETARAIQATDLRRRLNWRRRDEFGELANTFDEMLTRLESVFKRQAQFTADASHELRTPLTVINLEVNRALTQYTNPSEFRQTLEIVQAENEHMTSIVNGLLLLARADSGPQGEYCERVDLSDVALACVERLLPLAEEKSIQIFVGQLPELLVSGDSLQLGRMVTNILDNAIKYTSDVGQRVNVELASEDNRWAVLCVQDDGPGIAEEHLDYLFDRFYRVDKARTQHDGVEAWITPGGSGLGLAIVKWIVQSHGGQVSVESQAGFGCCFKVRIPLSESA